MRIDSKAQNCYCGTLIRWVRHAEDNDPVYIPQRYAIGGKAITREEINVMVDNVGMPLQEISHEEIQKWFGLDEDWQLFTALCPLIKSMGDIHFEIVDL